ncbi:unnamed protein product [Urochloa humidicola]
MQKAAPMHLFVSKFNELQSGRNKQESAAVFGTNQRSRSLRTKFPIEEHADAVYTRAVYEIFSYQLHRSRSYIHHQIKTRREHLHPSPS